MKDINVLIKQALDQAATEAEHCDWRCKCAACQWLSYLLAYPLVDSVIAPPLFPDVPINVPN